MTMTTCNTIPCPDHTQRVSARVSAFGLISTAFATANQRRALRKLDTDALQDIGLTKPQAKAEASRSFWDVPATWRS